MTVAALLAPFVLAAEEVPGGTPIAVLSVPLGLLVFLGSIYLLLRANLGTKRAYLVFGTSLFGFMVLMSLFWAFGAPGTPQATGPTNLPGQVPDEYLPTWTEFAIDSRIAELPTYSFVREYPEGFGEVPADFADEAEIGASDIQSFFASTEGGEHVDELWPVEQVLYAQAPNNFPVIAATFTPVDETGEPTGEEPVTFFAFFDEGAVLFPSMVVLAVSAVLFLLHAVLLDRDEARERRELADAQAPDERVPAGV